MSRSLLDGPRTWPWWLLLGCSVGVTLCVVVGGIAAAAINLGVVVGYGAWARRKRWLR